MHYLRPILLLTLAYLAFTSSVTVLNIIAGLVIATGITFLLRPEARQLQLQNLPAAVVALVRYVLVLAYDLVVSGIQVARIVLSPDLPIEPGIIAIPSRHESELGAALSAHAITLTPGELVVEIDEDGTMYTHTLTASKAKTQTADAQEMRAELLDKILQ